MSEVPLYRDSPWSNQSDENYNALFDDVNAWTFQMGARSASCGLITPSGGVARALTLQGYLAHKKTPPPPGPC